MGKKKESTYNMQNDYIDLKNYELEEGTLENMKVGAEYIISAGQIDFNKKYFKYTIRRKLNKGERVDGVYIFEGETDEEYKRYYVDTIKSFIKNGTIYKLNKKNNNEFN